MSKSNPENLDPITKTPGAHPVGTGIGAVGGAAAGAAVGSVVGPIGTIAGGVVGAIAGGLAGKEIAENANPTEGGVPSEHELGTGVGASAAAVTAGAEVVNPDEAEDRYWSESYRRAPYYASGLTYHDYRPAYGLGWRARGMTSATFEAVEWQLREEWSATKGASRLTWEQAKHAVRDAWDRASRDPGRGECA